MHLRQSPSTTISLLWNFHRFIFMLISMVHLILNAKWLEELARAVLFPVLCFESLRLFRFVSFGFALEFGSLVVCAFMSQCLSDWEKESHRFYIVRTVGGDHLIDGALIAWSRNISLIHNMICVCFCHHSSLQDTTRFVSRPSIAHPKVLCAFFLPSYAHTIDQCFLMITYMGVHSASIYSHILTSLSVFNSF